MNINRFFLFIFLVLLILSTGCWDSSELTDESLVFGVGIDQIPGDEPILITLQLIKPSQAQGGSAQGNGTGDKQYHVISSKGKTFTEANRNFVRIWPRNLTFAHNRVIIFGKDFAAEGIFEVLDFLERNREIRRRNRILIAKGSAREVLENQSEAEVLPAEALEKALNRFEETTVTDPVNLNEFLLRLKSEAKTSLAPVVELGQEENSKQILLEKTGIISNGSLIGILNKNQSEGLLWLINKVKGDVIVIPFAKDKEISLDITRGNTTINPKLNTDGILMEINCSGKALLRETENYLFIIKDVSELIDFEKKAELILKSKVEQTIRTAQKDLKTDYIGFADQIYNYNPQEWKLLKKDWDKRFPQVQYKVKADISIVNIGLIKDSVIKDLKKE